ncbi:hypothetical protein GCK72_024422 [Caenorhabditis remanei]|uniref:Uncharacterized protein n=1 Tax=Caenorhabditis remanei TaxID=31234 RepID=A0A6A5FZ72_CAERE|nr:hypothetical protein GCK72_024422 [Caenorhabditis remanei]KAF1747956.1 hypothetical protein GCK72_024422 [Caenorhabditis remanei]
MAAETSTKEQFIQFYGPVDIPNYQYREFRVREANLANKSKNGATSKDITDGLRHITDKHNQRISDLKKQIREIEKINSSWKSLEKVTERDVKSLLIKVLETDDKSIEQFEIDNFCADHDWMSTKKAKDGITLKTLLSSINKIDEYGNQLTSEDDEEDNGMKNITEKTCKEDTLPAHSESDDSVNETTVVNVAFEKKPNGVEVIHHSEIEKSDRVENSSITSQRNLLSIQPEEMIQLPVEKLDQKSENAEETVDTSSQSEENSGKDSDTENDETENETDSEIENEIENENSHKERRDSSTLGKKDDIFKPFYINFPDDKEGFSILDKKSIDTFKSITQKLSEDYEMNNRAVLDVEAETAEEKEKEKEKKLVISVLIAELTKMLAIHQNNVAFDIDKIRALNVMNTAAKRTLETVHEENPEEAALNNSENGIKRNSNGVYSNGDNIASLVKTDNSEDERSDEEGDEDDECFETARSEESFETTNTSTTADSETQDRNHSPKPVLANKSRAVAPHANRKKRSKKGKKGKKPKTGPKMTVEEIEAIKKKKKEEKDREFEKKDSERKCHLEKVDTSDRHKLFRKVVKTALLIIKTDGLELPKEIKQLDNDLEIYVDKTNDMERTTLRDQYFETRTVECTTMYVGAELMAKMDLLSAHQDLIYKSIRLFQYFMYLGSLDETSEEFCEFELAMLKYFFAGYEQNTVPTSESTDLEKNFFTFVCEVLPGIPETDQFVNTVRFVRNKLLVFSDMAATINITSDEKILREGYMAIGQLLKQYKISTDLAAFLYTFRENTSYALMEAWFLESRRPVPFQYDV